MRRPEVNKKAKGSDAILHFKITDKPGGGEDVYEVRLLSSSLEDAYLEAVGGPAQPARELT